MEFSPEEWEANRATFMAEYPEGTWVQLEGGTLDVGIVRAATRRERWLRPAFWLLHVLRLRRVSARIHRWAAPEAHAELDSWFEAYTGSARLSE